jgi:hypothetical protein
VEVLHGIENTVLIVNLLGDRATTDRTETTASTGNFLGVFGLTDHTEGRVQKLDAEPANAKVQPTCGTDATLRRARAWRRMSAATQR